MGKKIELESRNINIKSLESFGVDCFCGKFFITNKTIANLLHTRRGDSCTDVVHIVANMKGIYVCDNIEDTKKILDSFKEGNLRRVDGIEWIKEKKKKAELRKLNRKEVLVSKPIPKGSSKQLSLLS